MLYLPRSGLFYALGMAVASSFARMRIRGGVRARSRSA